VTRPSEVERIDLNALLSAVRLLTVDRAAHRGEVNAVHLPE
jgi:hypothetical protein